MPAEQPTRRNAPLICSNCGAEPPESDVLLVKADLAREMSLTPKHMNHLVNGKSGSLGLYDYAAFTLGFQWEVRLVER